MINHGKSIFPQSNLLLEVRRIKPIHFSVFFVDGPSVVKLRLQGKTLSAGKSHQIKCEAIGAKPQATITWWVGGKQVRKMRALPFCNYYVMICILDVSIVFFMVWSDWSGVCIQLLHFFSYSCS